MKNILYGYVKFNNVNLLIFSLILLMLICGFACKLEPFLYNIICGPFPITDEELIEISEDREFLRQGYSISSIQRTLALDWLTPRYSRGKEFYFVKENMFQRDQEWSVYKPSLDLLDDHGTATSFSNIDFGFIQDKLLWCVNYSRWSSGFILRPGAASARKLTNGRYAVGNGGFPPDSKYVRGYILQEGDVLNLIANMGDGFIVWTCIGTVACLALILWWLNIFTRVIRRFRNIKAHPVFEQIDDLDGLLTELEEGYERMGKAISTKSWVLERKLFGIDICKKKNVL